MIRVGLASIAAFAAMSIIGPASSADAQSGSSVSASNVQTVPGRGFGGVRGGFERGNFPVPGLPSWSDSFGHRNHFRFGFHRPGRIDRPDRPNRPHRRHRRHRDDVYDHGYGYAYGYGIGIGGVIDPDRGYFATGGEAIQVGSGHVDYDYDRGYPYDHYRPGEQETAYDMPGRPSYCETRWTRDGQSKDRVPVRICRN